MFKKTIIQKIRDNKFLGIPRAGDTWSGSDTEEAYLENLKTQSHDWYYRKNTVRYQYNRDGYRTREFKEIDWENSIVLFGCSVVEGIGLDNNDTISSQLEKLLDIPVINMGTGGSSMLLNLHNMSILRDGYPTPKAVITIWPNYQRIVEYDKFDYTSYGNWDMPVNSLMDIWFKKNDNAVANAIFMSKIGRLLWEDKCQYLEYAWCTDTSKILKCKETLPKWKDTARDLCHPGIESAKATANKIAMDIKKCR